MISCFSLQELYSSSNRGLVIAKGLAANGAQTVYIAGRREEVLKKAAEESEGKLVP